MKKIAALLTGVLLTCASCSVWAADPVRRQQLELVSGVPAQKLNGKIKGYESVEYSIAVPSDGELKVTLKSANTSNYFNVTADGADEALFVGSRDGSRYQAKVNAGRYKVIVYLMRNAARRNQTASYVLEAGVSAPGIAP
jgi:hypothetical protein